MQKWASQEALMAKNPPTNAGDSRDVGSILLLWRYPRGGHGNSLQYSFLENPMAEEPGGLQSMGWHRVGHDWSDLASAAAACVWNRRDSNRKTHLMWPRASWALGEVDCHFCCTNFPNSNFFIHKCDQIIIESSPGKPWETLKPSWIIFTIGRV